MEGDRDMMEEYEVDDQEFDDQEFDEDELDRFYAKAENSITILDPQCIECRWNEGLDQCAVYGTKPADHLANIIDCPKRA